MFNGNALSGFSWNSENQLIEAEEEVWADLISEDADEDIQILRQTFVTPSKVRVLKNSQLQKVVNERADAPAPEPESFEKSVMNTFSDIANVMREGNKAFENRNYTYEDIENRLEPMGLEPEELANA
ncbi:hypothetical protein LXL04_030057 [Taraxacum kok-saghyz]